MNEFERLVESMQRHGVADDAQILITGGGFIATVTFEDLKKFTYEGRIY